MKKAFYPRLAADGIRKNRQLYLPYLLSCTGTVLMWYIMQSLSVSPLLKEIEGGATLFVILPLGKWVIAVFAVLFLFYTNSFLVRRRYREFGLYSVLGMSRGGIGRIILWESLISSGISLAAGLVLGILLSKLAELGLLNMIRAEISYRFTFSAQSAVSCLILFGAIFALLAVKSLIQVRRSNPLELLRSENVGEKPPKANWVFALAGAILLGTAYWMSVSIQNPITALNYFFIAVLLVIAATYLLFMSGSVALCRLLQKNKKYYYQKHHFVSVSNMAYRMKRNGAGLASVCILATMVLVMISSTSSLYFGSEDALNSQYPRDTQFTVQLKDLDTALDGSGIARLHEDLAAVAAEYQLEPQNQTAYTFAEIFGQLDGSSLNPDYTSVFAADFNRIRQLVFVGADEYNRVTGADAHPAAGEALVYPYRCDYAHDTLSVSGLTLKIAGRAERFISIPDAGENIAPVLILVVPSLEELRPLASARIGNGTAVMLLKHSFSYDSPADRELTGKVFVRQRDMIFQTHYLRNGGVALSLSAGCKPLERDEFLSMYGGLFFLGIVLSVLFIFAAAVIIYYKQVSEGYEDQKRFTVMRNVGMTKKDIRKTINSQIVTVFFAPLLFAGLHLAFAFPVLWKLLTLFSLNSLSFVLIVTAAAFVLFSVFYALIYKATAHSYYDLVSSSDGKAA